MNGQFNIGQISPLGYFLSIAVLLGLLFAFIAPDDNDTKSIFLLITQWQLQSVIPMLFLIGTHVTLHHVHRFNSLNNWLQLLLSGFLGVALYSPIGVGLDFWLENEEFDPSHWAADWINEFGALAPPILITWVAINAPWLIGFRISKTEINSNSLASAKDTVPASSRPSSDDTHTTASETGDGPILEEKGSFWEKIPQPLGKDIIYMEAELHYLKVVTERGSTLILYNLRDAINELQYLDGFQSHRSFWVAKAFVKELIKDGRQGELTTTIGERIPVSRNNMRAALDIWQN